MTDTVQVAVIGGATAIVVAVVGLLARGIKDRIQEVHVLINNRMDELLKAARSESHAAGVVAGRAAGIVEQQDRVNEAERVEDRTKDKG